MQSKKTRSHVQSLAIHFLILLSFGLVHAEKPETRELGSAALEVKFEKIREKYKLIALAGVNVSAEKPDELITVGYRTKNKEHKVELRDQWHIGSITKSMTATLAAILVKEKQIQWSSSIQSIWPELETHPSYKDVTLAELLSHKAGITKDITKTTDWIKRFSDKRALKVQREEWVGNILTLEPESKRGEFLYSNASYVVAGAMLEEVTDQSWESLMQEKLFQPLGMKSSGFGAPRGEAPRGHSSTFFGTKAIDPESKIVPADNPAAMGPAGTVHASLEDMVAFIRLHLGHYPKILNKEELRYLHSSTVLEDDYHVGFRHVNRTWAKGKALTHSGSNTFWYANLWIAPKAKSGTFTVTNIASDGAFNALDEATVELLQPLSH
ncbi:serine hydrolase domain-containing protein [Pleionea sediminis]|uniref:serine hydrolase domain-containing protein n=1 Tax=Pleionea sediminis TaxID=2569479 RepID=UPI001186218F|nr:serine hydrolase domain-containing protein [Pleionea sediminis]